MNEEAKSTGSEEKEEAAQVEDLEALKKALAEAKAQAEANLVGWQRAQADFANYKRRSEEEKEENRKSANAALITDLLPILDDFDRALSAIPPELAEQRWVDGVSLIQRKCRANLEAQGLVEIKAVGEPFDPRFHEAIKQDKGKEGIVIQEIEKGYALRDRVLRPSKVIVGNGEEAEHAGNVSPEGQETGEENGSCQKQ